MRGVNAMLDKKIYSPLTYYMYIRLQDNSLVKGAEEKDEGDNGMRNNTRFIVGEE